MLTVLLAESCRTVYDNLPTRRGVPLKAVEVAGSSATLWRIETTNARPVADLRYGVVPPDFRQVVPVSHPPRLLVSGEPLKVKYEYADGSMTLDATAVGVSGISPNGLQSSALPN